MIVYDNLNSKTVQQILEEQGDELRTDPMILAYEPEGDTTVYLSNMFDIPCITIRQEDRDVTGYASAERMDRKYSEMLKEYFGEYEKHPYTEWLKIQQQMKDEGKTLLELKQFISRCAKRTLSTEFKAKLKAAIATI